MSKSASEIEVVSGGQRWTSTWHGASEAPEGQAHGSAGICLTDTGGIVIVSSDGISWDFPAGRPERDESWEDTLRRELMEEACVVVQEATLVGFTRGRCIEGPEAGLVLVRAIWLANVRLLDWQPKFEMGHRKIVPIDQAISLSPSAYRFIWQRAFIEAKLTL